MIFKFFNELQKRNINFALINGYEDLFTNNNSNSDIDILLRKNDFIVIEKIIREIYKTDNIQIVQVLHHDLYAKNIFLYNPDDAQFLNLDLYGELSRKEIKFFDEKRIFNSLDYYKEIPILSPEKEFINYLVKKLDKDDLTQENFEHLRTLFLKTKDACIDGLIQFFPKKYKQISNVFLDNNYNEIINSRGDLINNFYSVKRADPKRIVLNKLRSVKRIMNPTGLTISFLGPDGSGKSTIINELLDIKLPFLRNDYFHLKPLKPRQDHQTNIVVTEPHASPPYSKIKSYIKLTYFIYQYSTGWMRNIYPLKNKASLIIFDRYFDDMFADQRRYRYGGNILMLKLAHIFIPKPDLYFILTTDAKVIYKRKQEVAFEELEKQIEAYNKMADSNRYFKIDVDRSPEEITKEILTIMMKKMNECN